MDRLQQWPQPHEGISGTDRTGTDLVSLAESASEHRDALVAMARHLQTATSVGNPAPVVERMAQRLRAPQPGDLVVESSSGMWRTDQETRHKAFGFLIAKRTEWWETDEQWATAKTEDGSLTDDDRMTDEAWYVQYGPNAVDVCRWTNCSFMVIPITSETFSVPVGTRDGSAVVITRDSLLGSLADSGFTLNLPGGAS